MKVLLIKDVYKLGHAGDVKKVADGYGRNFLLPQGLAVLATAGALTTVEKIRAKAAVTRATLNQEMGGLASMVEGIELYFTSKAGETGKLYGSVTTQMIADALNEKLGSQVERHQVEVEPIRTLGEHIATIRLTIDLNPKVKVFVTREGAPAEAPVKVAATKEEEKIAEVVIEEVILEMPVEEAAIEEVSAEEPSVEETPSEENKVE